MGQGGVGFNSDRAEVWDGATWSFATWGEHTLSEPRHLMGSAVIEISGGAVGSRACVFCFRPGLYILVFLFFLFFFFFQRPASCDLFFVPPFFRPRVPFCVTTGLQSSGKMPLGLT